MTASTTKKAPLPSNSKPQVLRGLAAPCRGLTASGTLPLPFWGGCLMTYLCMRLKSRLDSSRLSRKELGMSEQQPVDDVSLPASLGLSPMALSLQTGSAHCYA